MQLKEKDSGQCPRTIAQPVARLLPADNRGLFIVVWSDGDFGYSVPRTVSKTAFKRDKGSSNFKELHDMDLGAINASVGHLHELHAMK